MTRTIETLTGCIVLVGLAGWIGGCSRQSETPPPDSSTEGAAPGMAAAEVPDETPLKPEPGTMVISLDITGMHCDSCAQTVSQRLGQVTGVRKAKVSFTAKTAWVMVEQTGGPRADQLIQAVEDAGYKAAPALNTASAPSSEPT